MSSASSDGCDDSVFADLDIDAFVECASGRGGGHGTPAHADWLVSSDDSDSGEAFGAVQALPAACQRNGRRGGQMGIAQLLAVPRTWTCPACTFINTGVHGRAAACGMCSTARKPRGAAAAPPRAEEPKRTRQAAWQDEVADRGLERGQRLHAWQEGVLAAWMQGRDCLILSGTGSGKSLCFQAPVWLPPAGIVVVVSPLIALMRDQVLQITARRRCSACFLGSAQKDKAVEPAAMAGEYSLIYTCPETLARLAPDLANLHKAVGIKLCAVDEAHCVSQWGHDFRPSYRRIRGIFDSVEAAGARIPMMALTATATARVRQEVCGLLFHQPAAGGGGSGALRTQPHLSVNTFARPNLSFAVRPLTRRAVVADLRDVLRIPTAGGSHTGEGGCSIVYVPTRKDTEKIAEELQRNGVRAAPYHAGLPRKHLDRVQEDFLGDRVRVVVATVAFGLGINKADVRAVVHYGWPQSMSQYYQEAGRAGRDGQPAQCVMFLPLHTQPKLLPPSTGGARSTEQTLHCLRALEAIYLYALRGHTCRGTQLLRYFGEATAGACGKCDVCTATPPACAAITPASVLQLIRAANTGAGDKGRWVTRLCRDQHGGSLSYWRGLGRVLRDSTPAYLADAATTPQEVLECCAAGRDFAVPVVGKPRPTAAGLALLSRPAAEVAQVCAALEAEADMDEAPGGGAPRERKRQRGAGGGGEEHWAKRKYGNKGKGRGASGPRKCFQCGQVGHRKRDCPTLPPL